MSARALKHQLAQSLIIAYREDTSELERALAAEGVSARVLRPAYTEVELTYSRTIRCLLNHANAWRAAADAPGLTLIVEADFVPCVGFGDLPLPWDPAARGDQAWGYLYSAAPRIFGCLPDGTLPGHSATTVAYVVSPCVAAWLCDYVREEMTRHGDLTTYSLWDTQYQWHMMGRGATCFMPFRNYGEHGGIANREHGQAGIGVAKRVRLLSWLGVGRNHHADVLYARLKFLPLYAQGSRRRLWRTRLEAKLLGWLKLLTGRIVMLHGPASFREKVRLHLICARRLCARY